MKSVLLSIRPEWCNHIFVIKDKTVEIRKSCPNIDEAFKCYVYETRGDKQLENEYYHPILKGKGTQKIIGEFICDYCHGENAPSNALLKLACLSCNDVLRYANGKMIYSWHISNPILYDKPKELSEFVRKVKRYKRCKGCEFKAWRNMYSQNCEECIYDDISITRPPQSWCYVEEVNKNG